jgi:hypothetical protein
MISPRFRAEIARGEAPLPASLGSALSALPRRVPDADGEDVDAPCARMREIEERGNLDARDRAAGRSCVVDGSVDATTLRGGGDRLPVGAGLTDAVLEQLLFANAGVKPGHRRHAEPDWAVLHREMRRKHVTLSILLEEYITANPGGYRYSRFCELYRE